MGNLFSQSYGTGTYVSVFRVVVVVVGGGGSEETAIVRGLSH